MTKNKTSRKSEIQQDNTRVYTQKPVKPIRLTQEQIRNIQLKELQNRKEERIYDTNKAKYYENLQNFYNENVFGYGIQGKQTNYDPTTPSGQAAIQSNFDYAKSNAKQFMQNVAGVGFTYGANKAITKLFDGVFPTFPKGKSLGNLKQYSKNPIGSGAEAIVIENTPTTVGKITSIPVEEMEIRNQIPNVAKSKYVGYVKDNGVELPTYIQKKLKVLDERSFPKYIDRLDKSMQKSGFSKVDDPSVQYRAYTNGNIVIDDVSPDNIGLDWLGRPKMIDFNVYPISEWNAFKKTGGKLTLINLNSLLNLIK